MNINNLKEYLKEINSVPNYRRLCKILEIEALAGSTKVSHMKEIQRYFKFHKQGNSFIFDKIYDEPLAKIDGRKDTTGNNFIEFDNFLVEREDMNKMGIYSIILENDIYIGSTIKGFRSRFMSHKHDNNVLPTREMLKNGATFQIIEVCEGMTEPQIRDSENDYIEKYRSDEDWNIINEKNAWSYTPKQKYKTIKFQVKEEDYEGIMEVLKERGLVN